MSRNLVETKKETDQPDPKVIHVVKSHRELIKFLLKYLDKIENVSEIGVKIQEYYCYVADHCVFDKNYNKNNYENYYGIYKKKVLEMGLIPIIENVNDIRNIGNDDCILKITSESKIIKILIL